MMLKAIVIAVIKKNSNTHTLVLGDVQFITNVKVWNVSPESCNKLRLSRVCLCVCVYLWDVDH